MHLITTQTGKTIAVENLLEKGQFQALLKDYPQLGQPLFGEDCIHVIQDARGRLLDDISTDEEKHLGRRFHYAPDGRINPR